MWKPHIYLFKYVQLKACVAVVWGFTVLPGFHLPIWTLILRWICWTTFQPDLPCSFLLLLFLVTARFGVSHGRWYVMSFVISRWLIRVRLLLRTTHGLKTRMWNLFKILSRNILVTTIIERWLIELRYIS